MKWLAQRQQERRWWTASASVAICGLVLGVLGVVPAFADLSAASCTTTRTGDTVEIAWDNVPEGLALVVLAQDADGNLTPVQNDSGEPAGFGPAGTWTGPAAPGAVGYHIHGNPADGGGTLRCTDAAAPATTPVAATNAVGAANPGFASGTCPTASTGDAYGWHFIARGEGRVVESVNIVFAEAGAVTWFAPGSTQGQVYVYTPGPDEIVSAEAVISGGVSGPVTFELLFVCGPDTPDQPDDPGDEPPISVGDPRLEATIGVDCDADAVTIEVRNLGDVTGVAEIEVDGVVVQVVTVAPDATTAVSVAAPDAGTVVRVLVGGVAVATSTYGDPCTTPSPELEAIASVDCDTDTVVVAVTNRGDGAGSAVVTIGLAASTVDVAPGATERVTVPRPAGDSVAVLVTVDGATVLRTTLDTTCDEPEPYFTATVSLVCADDAPAARVGIDNAGNGAGSVVVDVNGVTTTVQVAAGEQRTVMVPVPATGPVNVTVRTADGTTLASVDAADVCDDPEPELGATAVLDCVDGEIRVTITNTGDADGVATVDVGGAIQSVVVPAAGTSVVTVDVAPGTDVRVVVHDGQRQLLDQRYDDACSSPEPAIAATWSRNCDTRTVAVVVTNTGDADGTATVQLGAVTETRRLAPGARATVSMPAPAGAAATLTVRGDVGDVVTTLIDVSVDPCGQPRPDVTAVAQTDCQLGEIVLSMTNRGDGAATVRWTINNRAETATIAPGTTLVVSEDIVIGETNRATVVVGDTTVLDESVPDACRPDTPQIGAEFDIDCTNDEIVVRVYNNGGADGTARVAINGEITDVVVPAGELSVVRVDLPADAGYLVDVSSNGTSILTEQGTATECLDTPSDGILSARVSLSCRYDEATVTVRNDDDERRDVTVTFNGDVETATLRPGDEIEMTYPLTEDGRYEISVVDENGQSLAYARGVHDCVDVGGIDEEPPPHVDDGTPIRLPTTGANTGVLVAAGLTFIIAGVFAVQASKFRRERLIAV